MDQSWIRHLAMQTHWVTHLAIKTNAGSTAFDRASSIRTRIQRRGVKSDLSEREAISAFLYIDLDICCNSLFHITDNSNRADVKSSRIGISLVPFGSSFARLC